MYCKILIFFIIRVIKIFCYFLNKKFFNEIFLYKFEKNLNINLRFIVKILIEL